MKKIKRIVCLTEESVEILHLLGKLHLVKGVSIFVKRPKKAMKIPRVTQFTKANIQKIVALKPDLVLGFSDIQKDIARELIGLGLNVWISNQRSIEEILSYTQQLGYLIGSPKKTDQLITRLENKIHKIQSLAGQLKYRPTVYFEEWDEPQITAIRWVSELINLSGGINVFAKKSLGSLAQNRIIGPEELRLTNPDIILTCWCGKKFNSTKLNQRLGPLELNAVKNDFIYNLPPEVFLQPGPAPILEGLEILFKIFKSYPRN